MISQFFFKIRQDMSSKYTYDNYTITVDFKTDFALSITASDVYTGDYFINEAVELTKIKKDTVVAALTRKNEKNLKCQFNVVDVEPKKLIIAFQVSFDYLPTFIEYISLEQIQKKGKGINKVESAELKSDLEDLQKLIDTLSNKTGIIVVESSHSFNPKGEIFNRQVQKGSYLLELSGFFVCSGGAINKHDLIFTLKTSEQQFTLQTVLHTNGGYGYPYSLRKEFIILNKSVITLNINHKQNQSYTLNNNIVTLSPMLRVK